MSEKNKAGKGPGAPKGNLNAYKHGKYSQRRDIILTCATCAAVKQCDKYNAEKKKSACSYEKIEKPDLGSVEGLINFLKDLIEMDFLRLRRCYQFEILTGGMIDGEAIKLGQHIRNIVFTIAKLTELSEVEKQIQLLDERTREILTTLAEREAKEARLVEQMKALEEKIA